MSELTIRIFQSIQELEEIRRAWISWQDHPNADIDLYLSRFSVNPQFVRPFVIVVYRDACPDTALVGRLDNLRLDLKVGYIHLPKPRARVLNFIYSGLLGNASIESCQLIVGAIVNALREGEADLAAFNNIRLDSPIYDLIAKAPGVASRDHCPLITVHCSMSLPSSVDEVYLSLSAKSRKNLKWQAKQLVKQSPDDVHMACFRETGAVDGMIREVEKVAAKTYQRGLGVGFVDTRETRERLLLAARKDWLRTYVLYVGSQPCAFCVGTLYGGTYYTDFIGYDATYAKYSPGTFLLMTIFDECCRENVRRVDFGYGAEDYKQRFGNCKWYEAMVSIYAPTVRGFILKCLITQTLLVEHVARKTLYRLKLLPRMKRSWRKAVRGRQGKSSGGKASEQYNG